ncbi:MAG: hypothetical protein ABL967_19025 [Bryobacteraceae bacterium]
MIKQLIAHFSDFTKLPVNISTVVEAIRESGVTDEINFFAPEIDGGIVRGFFHRRRILGKPYGDDVDITDIYYSNGSKAHWINLVCCKELMHLFDETPVLASTKEKVSTLITDIVVPSDISCSAPGISDHVTIFWALALLFPWDARELLIEPLKAGKLNTLDIAKMARLPHRYIGFLMSDNWARLYNTIK